jgi:hypothetical protein
MNKNKFKLPRLSVPVGSKSVTHSISRVRNLEDIKGTPYFQGPLVPIKELSKSKKRSKSNFRSDGGGQTKRTN